MASTLYISFDLETVGGNPEHLPVINWGFVAYTSDRKKVSSLSVNTKALVADPNTVAWFNSTPEMKSAYEQCTENPMTPEAGITTIRDWMVPLVKEYNGKVVLVAYPTIFDGSLLYYYWFRYLGHPAGGKGPGFTILDIRSYAAGKLGISYFDASKEKALKIYRPNEKDMPHTHTGIDDAEEQMWLLFNIMDAKL